MAKFEIGRHECVNMYERIEKYFGKNEKLEKEEDKGAEFRTSRTWKCYGAWHVLIKKHKGLLLEIFFSFMNMKSVPTYYEGFIVDEVNYNLFLK